MANSIDAELQPTWIFLTRRVAETRGRNRMGNSPSSETSGEAGVHACDADKGEICPNESPFRHRRAASMPYEIAPPFGEVQRDRAQSMAVGESKPTRRKHIHRKGLVSFASLDEFRVSLPPKEALRIF